MRVWQCRICGYQRLDDSDFCFACKGWRGFDEMPRCQKCHRLGTPGDKSCSWCYASLEPDEFDEDEFDENGDPIDEDDDGDLSGAWDREG
jgi:hypothetical protein